MSNLRLVASKLLGLLKRFCEAQGPVRASTVVGWGLLAVLVEGIALWAWYQFQVDLHELSVRDRWDLGLKAGGGVVVIVGLALTAWRISVANRQAEAALKQAENAAEQAKTLAKQAETAARQVAAVEDGQVTERFTRAVEQLGSEKEEVRLGAIYALERIARDSERDHWPVMEILAAFLRKHSKAQRSASKVDVGNSEPDGAIPSEPEAMPCADILAAVGTIGRRTGRKEPRQLDLRATQVAEADLIRADLEGVCFRRAILERALLMEANLSWADLMGANLEGALLEGANLFGANLFGANLRGVNLYRANLDGADFEKTIVENSNLDATTLRKCKNLTIVQLSTAHIDEHTILPDYLEQYKDELLEAQKCSVARPKAGKSAISSHID